MFRQTKVRGSRHHRTISKLIAALASIVIGCGGQDAGDAVEGAQQGILQPPEAACTSVFFNEHAYWFCSPLRSWSNARTRCQSVGFDLVRVDSAAENTMVRSNTIGAPWIGASDTAVEGAWRWAIGQSQFWSGLGNGTPVGGLYRNWATFQPDNFANQDCARMTAFASTWEDTACAVLNPYVCESVQDLCPSDPGKVDPGICGCGVPDVDSDGDGTLDCRDRCPNDPARLQPGDCGCADAPSPAGTACRDGLCAANNACDGAGSCGQPSQCVAPDLFCTSRTFGGRYYWICNFDRLFSDARQRCQAAGMDVIALESAAEDAYIGSQLTEHVLIGASDGAVEGDWVWLPTNQKFWTGGHGGTPFGGAFSHWDIGEPDVFIGDCAVKDPPLLGGQWEVTSCLDPEGFVCEKAIPQKQGQGFIDDPFFDRKPQVPNAPTSTTPISGYGNQHQPGSPRHELCGPGLELVASLDEVMLDRQLILPNPPTNTIPLDPNCNILYRECNEDEQPLATPTPLNAKATASDICGAVPPSFPCGIDESTIDFAPDGLCQLDEECIAKGMVCALVCTDVTCGSQQRRCARQNASCNGLPEESLCTTVRECAEPDAVGQGNAGPHQMSNQPATDVHPKPTPDPATDPADSTLPPAYTIGDPCQLQVDGASAATIPEQVEPRDADAGNDKWGVFIHPEVTFQATAAPRPLFGEAAHLVKGEASLKAGANVWGREVEILEVAARAALSQCAATVERVVQVMGESVAVGADPPPFNSPACQNLVSARGSRGNELKKSLLDALSVKDHISRAGASVALCEKTRAEFGPNFTPAVLRFETASQPRNCANPVDRRAAVDHWVFRYRLAVEDFIPRQDELEAEKAQVVASLPTATLPVLNFQRNFTVFAPSFTFPVGPATVTIEIELGGSWGVFGDLSAEQSLPPAARIGAHATLQPALSATAIAFAGIGFGPVTFGVGGELLMIGLQIPLQAGATLQQRIAPDNRPINLLGVPATGVPLAFDKTLHGWEATWNHGARAELTALAGEINLQARIKLLFFKKTFKKRIAKWNGIKTTHNLVGGANPLDGAPDYGSFEEELVFVDPNWLAQQMTEAASPVPETVPGTLGICTAPVP